MSTFQKNEFGKKKVQNWLIIAHHSYNITNVE